MLEHNPPANTYTLTLIPDPLIFRGLKSITLADSQQVSILKLARAGIAVYSPHTAIDASPYGLGQWLAKLVAGDDQVTTSVIKPVTSGPKDEKFAGAGYGAVGTLSHPRSLSQVLSRLRAGLAVHQDTTLTGMLVARPRGASDPKDLEDVQIKSFAVCAGSGSSILACAPDVDLWVTGEMSHHEALKAVEEGRVVVTVSHSNSERRFLIDELQPWLQQELRNNNLDHLQKVDVVVSSEDEDPFRVVEVGQTLIERPF